MITRVGTTKKYAEGWDRAFGGKKQRARARTTAAKSRTSTKSAAKKAARKGK